MESLEHFEPLDENYTKIMEGVRKDVFKHSPDEDSKTGRVIQIFEAVIGLFDPLATSDNEEKIQRLFNSIP